MIILPTPHQYLFFVSPVPLLQPEDIIHIIYSERNPKEEAQVRCHFGQWGQVSQLNFGSAGMGGSGFII